MYRYFQTFPYIFCLATALCGCRPTQPIVPDELENSFRELVPIVDMNNSFRIEADSVSQDNLKFGTDIHVVVDNLSNKQIFFPLGYGIRLFIIRDNGWLEIQNKNKYYGDGSLLRPKGQQELSSRISTWIRPVLPSSIEDEGRQEVLRIVFIGELISDGEKTEIPVSSFTDVIVNP